MEEADVISTSSSQSHLTDLTPLIQACREQYPFPDPRSGPLDSPLVIGGRLTSERLISAYSKGIFPWSEENLPNLWWSPDPRFILRTDEFHAGHSLVRAVRKGDFEIKFDTRFREVITACAHSKRRDQDGTWITRETISAYTKLHEDGLAHSVECYQDGELTGGLYGVSIGKVFFGESMFHKRNNASKIALYHLIQHCRQHGIILIDCQVHTDHLKSMGATNLPRTLFLRELQMLLKFPTLKGSWG